jgi:hypothetical protein
MRKFATCNAIWLVVLLAVLGCRGSSEACYFVSYGNPVEYQAFRHLSPQEFVKLEGLGWKLSPRPEEACSPSG